ncbi:MAG TPA: hypothetical protein DCE56_02330 [Cyanobacteria bacterium UBA8553]|nr:hypothetical protein [Cyanobacteria bacterium UBA8553]
MRHEEQPIAQSDSAAKPCLRASADSEAGAFYRATEELLATETASKETEIVKPDQSVINPRDRLLDLAKSRSLSDEEKAAIKLSWITPFKDSKDKNNDT